MRLRFACLVSIVAACVFAGCGGGGGSSSAPAAVAPTATPGSGIQLFIVPADEGNGSPITEPSPGVIGVNEISIPFTAVGQQQGVLVFEPGFFGTFTVTVQTCSPAAVTATPSTYTGKQQFVTVLTATQAGICAVRFTDGTNGAVALVDVTTTTGTISSTTRH
jgi:hypothetical protein